MIPDCELLRRYAEHGDEAAFAEVVRRQVDLVYSAALRLVGGDAHLAQDVAQGVFTALARRAARLARHASITGWLYTTTRYTAGNLRRSRHRRLVREQEAYAMNQPAHSSEINWDTLQPVLDEAVCALAATDREAVLLRFFQNKSHREVGDALGLGEEAARKRVDRALEKLRAHFVRRGVAVSAGVLAAEIGANSVQAAPVGLAESLTGTSLAGMGEAAVFSSSTKIFLMTTKIKMALAGAGLLLAGLVSAYLFWKKSTVVMEQRREIISALKDSAQAQVVAPSVALMPAGAKANTGSTVQAMPNAVRNNPRDKLGTDIVNLISLIQSGDAEGYFNACLGTSQESMSPQEKAQELADFADMISGPHKEEILQRLEWVKDQKPDPRLDDGRAWYLMPNPDGTGMMAITFTYIDGQWRPDKWPDILPRRVAISEPANSQK